MYFPSYVLLAVTLIHTVSIFEEGRLYSWLKNNDHIDEIKSDDVSLLPPRWQEVPNLTDLPRNENNITIIDAWDYLQRQSLYKFLIENINHCLWNEKRFKDNQLLDKLGYNISSNIPILDFHPGNIMWGLPLQHGWQYSSGRLFCDPNDPNDTSIDTSAWWADMNYHLSILPYFGAWQAGLAPAIQLVDHNLDDNIFCQHPDFCLSDVTPWTDYFLLLDNTKDSCKESQTIVDSKLKYELEKKLHLELESNQIKLKEEKEVKVIRSRDDAFFFEEHEFNYPVRDRSDFNLSSPLERLLASLWGAHLHSIGVALPKFNKELELLSIPEQNFGRSWASIVDYIAETLFECNMVITDVLQNLLPHRLLQDSDQIPFVSDLGRLENRAVLFIDSLFKLNQTTNGAIDTIWDASMCQQEGRALGREMIALGIYRPTIIVDDFLLLTDIMKNQMKEKDDLVCTHSVKNIKH